MPVRRAARPPPHKARRQLRVCLTAFGDQLKQTPAAGRKRPWPTAQTRRVHSCRLVIVLLSVCFVRIAGRLPEVRIATAEECDSEQDAEAPLSACLKQHGEQAGVAACISVYETKLEALGPMSTQNRNGSVVRCRARDLGRDLGDKAQHVFEAFDDAVQAVESGNSSFWDTMLRSLRHHELNDYDRFHLYRQNFWHPPVFSWPEGGQCPLWANGCKLCMFNLLSSDPEYEGYWAKGTENLGFGPHGLKRINTTKPGGTVVLQCSPPQKVSHMFMLYHATNMSIPDLGLVVEFGGGTGELPYTMRALGYRGVYVIYDLLPMLLLQRYFTRWSGMASYLVGSELPSEASGALLKGRVALVPPTLSNSTILSDVLVAARAPLQQSLFIAAWSFTEASIKAREAIRPYLKGFGRLMVIFWDEIAWDKSVRNAQYLANWVREDFLETHHVCSWKVPYINIDHFKGSLNYYLIVSSKLHGPIRCLRRLGCNWRTLHPVISGLKNVSGGSVCRPSW